MDNNHITCAETFLHGCISLFALNVSLFHFHSYNVLTVRLCLKTNISTSMCADVCLFVSLSLRQVSLYSSSPPFFEQAAFIWHNAVFDHLVQGVACLWKPFKAKHISVLCAFSFFNCSFERQTKRLWCFRLLGCCHTCLSRTVKRHLNVVK